LRLRYSDAMSDPEVWLRGPIEGFDPMVMPVVHSLLQVREDLARLVQIVPAEQVWVRPGGAASIGFHIRHTGGALDRLLTYARGEALSQAQREALHVEELPGDPPASLASLVAQANAVIERSLTQLRHTSPGALLDKRRVGRTHLPSNVLGLVMHAAEHSTRHLGQAITTALILRGA
jgi:hypothetical protein